MNGDSGRSSTSGLKNFYGYKETFGKDSVWVDVPRERECLILRISIAGFDLC